MNRKIIKSILSLILLSSLISCDNKKTEEPIKDLSANGARMQVEGYEWGPAVNKIIISFEGEIKDVTKDTFTVKTAGVKRTVLDAYPSDGRGNKLDKDSTYLALDLEVKYNQASPFNYNMQSQMNTWQTSYKLNLTLTKGQSFNVGDTVYNSEKNFKYSIELIDSKIIPSTEVFTKDTYTNDDITLQRASFTPNNAPKDSVKNPLIIWLHGMGEGGTDIDIDLLGNEVTALTRDDIQNYFTTQEQKGAYVLAVQTPTMWMDSGDGSLSTDGSLENGQPSKYTEALFESITDYVNSNNDIDTDRIYLGGCSNGGYMTMNMMFTHGDYFAAYYPICEAYMNKNISDTKINDISNKKIWFIQSEDDTTVNPKESTIPTFYRLISSGAKDVHFTLFDHVRGMDDPHPAGGFGVSTPDTYMGHWSWINFFNDNIKTEFDNDKVKEDIPNITLSDGTITSDNNFVTANNCTKEGNIFTWLSKQSK